MSRPFPSLLRHQALIGGAALALLAPLTVHAQAARPRPPAAPNDARPVVQEHATLSAADSTAFSGVQWREVGPYRGGRSVIATGSAARPKEYYLGTTGGGVFKSVDGGEAWFPVTDRFFGGTIGAIAVAPSNPDVVYVGGGEYPIRGNVSYGDGVWKTTDGGRSWHFLGLGDTRQIARIVVHPTNPDLVYVGAFGHVWAPNAERGVFRSRDGGKTWEKVLFRDDSTGVADLVMDPANPNVLYASFWQAYRLPWTLWSGGKGSGLFKSTDGGDHWTEITRNAGLPAGIWGNSGLDVSASNPNRVYALIEANGGGLFRSDDAGATWTKMNGSNELTQRAWYYMKVHVDPKNPDVVYVNNVSFQKSTDGGRTFHPVRGLHHGDSHHLWIAPNDSRRMIETDDGGAEVTTDGGTTWTEEDYATAQFYHVIATTHFPYHVCGAQQDNSTLCGPSRSPSGAIDINEWQEAGGGESGWIGTRADNPDITYAGSYGALLTRKDMRTGLTANVNPWPDNPMGHPAKDLKYRFQWTFPIIVSPHNSNVVYAGSQHVHKSTNGGQSWSVISPDLTYNDKNTQGNSGGPLTKDQTSVEYYNVVFVIEESPRKQGMLWTGSDDGKLFLTQDDGKSWTDVTPRDMAKYTRVSSISASSFDACAASVAANRYQLDDDRPYAWRTTDCGRSWTRIDAGLAPNEFLRVVREDPGKRGLLFAGTERGVWMSPDAGAHWTRLQLNLPLVPVHDLSIKDGDLIAATHGRGFWIIDDISTLRQLSDAVLASDAHLFKPLDTYRVSWGGGRGGGASRRAATSEPQTAPVHPVGINPPSGVHVQYWLKSAGHDVTLQISDAQGKVIESFNSKQDSLAAADSIRREARRRSVTDSLHTAGVAEDSIRAIVRRTVDAPSASVGEEEPGYRPAPAVRAPNRRGVNSFNWDMRYPAPHAFRGMILWAAGAQAGPVAPPGTYTARLIVDGKTAGTESFRLLADPRLTNVTQADYDQQFALLMKVRDRFSEANDAVKTIRYVRYEVGQREKAIPSAQRERFTRAATALDSALVPVEDSVYQTQNRASEDPLNFPIRLNNKIGALMGVVSASNGRPTAQSYEVLDELSVQLDKVMKRMRSVLDSELPNLNGILKSAGLPAIVAAPVEVPVGEEPKVVP